MIATGKPKPHYPAGLPDFMGAMSNSTYLGRARFIPWFQCTGTGGPPCGKEIVADHYVKWFFHMFFDVETNLPVALTSPYGGCATYGNWTMTADALWPDWRRNPSHSINVADDDTCAPYN